MMSKYTDFEGEKKNEDFDSETWDPNSSHSEPLHSAIMPSYSPTEGA